MFSTTERKARFERVFKVEKPIIAMIHLGGGRDLVFSNARFEIQTFYELGATSVLVENYFRSARDVERTLDWLRQVYPERVYGVNILGDVRQSFELALEYGASFIQDNSVRGRLKPASKSPFVAELS